VSDNGGLRGVLSLRDVATVPKADWGRVTTGEAMVPLERLIWVQPDTELLAALQMMDDADVAQVPVVESGHVAGLLSREQVLRYIRARAELGI
jgi:CBS domain-containing protein